MANEKRLIDANALLEELDKFANPMPNKSGYDFLCGVASAITEIENAPTVDVVEVVHGRWVHPKDDVVVNEFFCSECDHREVSLRIINPLPGGGCQADENGNFYYPPRMNYCPNCGAKMDGDGNG